jgi:hypothetical protein
MRAWITSGTKEGKKGIAMRDCIHLDSAMGRVIMAMEVVNTIRIRR